MSKPEIVFHVKGVERIIKLECPKSFAQRFDVVAGSAKNGLLASAAALGLCWRGGHAPKARYNHSFSALQYGQEVLDELVEAGYSWKEVLDAGGQALSLVAQDLLDAGEVLEVEKNSEPMGA